MSSTFKIIKYFVLGKFNYKTDSKYVKVKTKHSTKAISLNSEVDHVFLKMYGSAVKQDIELKIISSTPNFNEQKAIWERKWNGGQKLNAKDSVLKFLEYSFMLCTSRHHWGTAIDLNSLNNSYFNSGKGLKEYQWLIKHATNFGFYETYANKVTGRTGYDEGKWHWSYLPLENQHLDYYNSNI